MNILAFAASLRRESFNRKLIELAAEMARRQNVEVDLAQFQEFEMPLYNGDLEVSSGLPSGALEFKRRLEEADGLMISSPQYNGSFPGILKNAIDWVSRVKPMPLRGRHALLLSASPSPYGGSRGLVQLRIPLEALGVVVFPETFSLPHADHAFDNYGKLKDGRAAEHLDHIIHSFLKTLQSTHSGLISRPA